MTGDTKIEAHWRDGLPSPLRHVLDSDCTGDVVGPVEIDGVFTLVRVVRRQKAVLDEKTHQRIQEILFDEWLNEQREQASIQWYWGRLQTS